MKKTIMMSLIACLLFSILCTPAFASEVRTGVPSESQSQQTTTNQTQSGSQLVTDTVNDITNDIAPNVTTDDIVNRLEDKGNDVVNILQTVGKYVCIASFIICCMLCIIGIIGNSRMVMGSIIGMIVSGLAYAGIVCGREIVNWIAAWAIS